MEITKTKTKNDYIYNGLGFPILLRKATFKLINKKWLLKLDVEKLSDLVIRALTEKPTGLTGAEIRFARTYFELSQRKFADGINVSHTAVGKWEDADQDRAHIEAITEMALRAFIRLRLNEDAEFPNFYRGMMNIAKNFANSDDTTPIRISA